MAANVEEKKCTGCGICVEACPVDAITIDQVAKIDAATCTNCGSCMTECPNGAISMERIEAASPSRSSPSSPPSQLPAMRRATSPVAPRPSGVQPDFQQVKKRSLLGQIFDFIGRFADQGRGQGYGRGKGRGGGRGRGKGRWR